MDWTEPDFIGLLKKDWDKTDFMIFMIILYYTTVVYCAVGDEVNSNCCIKVG